MKKIQRHDKNSRESVRRKAIKYIQDVARSGGSVYGFMASTKIWECTGANRFPIAKRHAEWLLMGYRGDNKIIFLWCATASDTPPSDVAKFLRKMENCGCIVGCLYDVTDSWDIVFNDNTRFKRKKRTYGHHRYFEAMNYEKKEESRAITSATYPAGREGPEYHG